MRTTSTKIKVLKEGRSLLQKHGYSGFSFQDIANTLEIKKPSLYDHYSSKESLIIAILNEYEVMFDIWTQKVENLSAAEKINQVFQIFYSFSCDGRKVCPVLSLLIDLKVLSKPIQLAMKEFVDKLLLWLTEVIEQGQAKKTIRRGIEPESFSKFIYSQVMGSQLQARIKNDPQLILESAEIISALILPR